MNNIDELIEEYYRWLKSHTGIKTVEATGWTQINLPFVGLFNDTIDIFVKKSNGNILLSDDGQTIHNLELVGVSFKKSPTRKQLLEKILLNFGIQLEPEGELTIIASEKDFPQKKHDLLSAILEISDMFMLAKHTVASIFKEDVKNYLEEEDTIYTPQFIARGATGIEFTFDFHIAYKEKEIVLKAFNRLTTYNLTHFLFAWQDIKETREKVTGKVLEGIAVVNDSEKRVKKELLDAIQIKNANYILWSERRKPENIQKIKSAA